MSTSNRKQPQELRSKSIERESFKCIAPCLYLPRFSKRKTMEHAPSENGGTKEMLQDFNIDLQHETESSPVICGTNNEVSKAFSFDRFTRSSCNSGIIFNLMADEEGWKSPFFDLPVELIRGRSIDAKLPVNTAFVFSCDPKKTMETKRALLLAQTKSLQLKSKLSQDTEFGRPTPFSCPTSPRSKLH